MTEYDERIPQLKQIPPKKKSNRRLLFLLLLFFLILLGVVFFRSPYSKVDQIEVYGQSLYSKEQIIKTSGLSIGMQFLNVWDSDMEERLGRLQGVKHVTVARHFPGTIRLNVEEHEHVAYMTKERGQIIPLLANGTLLTEQLSKPVVVDRPIIRSWKTDDSKLLVELAEGLAALPTAVLAEISDISLTPTPYDKQRVTLFMKDGNEVRSVVYQLKRKLVWYPAIVKELGQEEKGVVHFFESTWFSKYGSEAQTPIATETSATEGTNEQTTTEQ